MTNRRERQPAVYGKIRVLAGWEHLPKAAVGRPPPGRLLAAYMDRPLLAANFSAAESLDAWSGRSLDDWTTFHEGGLRLVEYLQHVGYNGLMISVLADGSTIYPSGLLEPTPRYDTGMFFDTAARTRCGKTCWRCCCGCSIARSLQLIPAVGVRRAAAGAGGGSAAAARRPTASSGSAPTARPGGRTTPPAAAWPPITTPSIRASRRRCWAWSAS